jgi:hypothetical protein
MNLEYLHCINKLMEPNICNDQVEVTPERDEEREVYYRQKKTAHI